MKFKTLVLMAASAIGFNVNAVDLNFNGYEEIDVGTSKPLILTDKYYTNSSGELYEIRNESIHLQYTLTDSSLISINGEEALGYMDNINNQEGVYYKCIVSECINSMKRKYFTDKKYFLYNQAPFLRSWQNMISGHGESLVVSKNTQGGGQFIVNVMGDNGVTYDSFETKGSLNSFIMDIWYISGLTGITSEADFKLLTASHGEYELVMKKWDDQLKKLTNVTINSLDGVDINSVYPNGLAPLTISEPLLDENGDTFYEVALVKLTSKETVGIDKVLKGSLYVEGSEAYFNEELSEVVISPFFLSIGGFTSYPAFFNDDTSLLIPNSVSITRENRTLDSYVYAYAKGGDYAVKENQGSYFLYLDRTGFKITVENENIDPYLDSSFTTVLSVNRYKYYGIEANCSLQTTNVAVNGGDYISLSETALQIPIEWDSLTGQWKGAQSLTGLESLSGSKEFAQFDLTADVTTGTWTMSCSGIASDIEGNKIALNPAEITINLDDKIHGGANIISGQINIPNTTNYSGVVVTITLNGRQIEVTTQEDGSFEFDRLVDGDYTVHVFSDQYVAACTNLTLSSDNINPVLNIPMYAGDINNDGGVDIGDFSLLSSLYGMNSEDEEYNALADLNHDGVINVQDLSILGSHFGVDHCEVAPQ